MASRTPLGLDHLTVVPTNVDRHEASIPRSDTEHDDGEPSV